MTNLKFSELLKRRAGGPSKPTSKTGVIAVVTIVVILMAAFEGLALAAVCPEGVCEGP